VLARTAQVIVCGLLGLAIGCSDGDVPAPCVGPGGDTPHPGAACAGTGAQGGAGGQAPTIECPESGVYHGPWSLHVDETSAVVRWDACKPSNADVTFEPEAGGPSVAAKGKQIASQVTTLYDTVLDTPPDLPGTYWLTEVVLEGLAPGTCYTYALAADPSLHGRLCTARPSGAPLTFMAIGDTNPVLGSTADTVSHAIAKNPDFTVHLGDIQYYASIFESWNAWFPLMRPLLAQGAFLPSIGNHEDEIPGEFTDYYTRYFGGAGYDGQLEYYRFESAGVWFFSLDTELDLDAGTPQAKWLVAGLAEVAAKPGFRFSVVFFHKPLITCGDTGQDKTARDQLQPIFEQYKVPLVLQGHMHGYERFEVGAVTYVTSAGGGGALGNVDENVDTRPEEAALRVASARSYNALILDVGATNLIGTVTDDAGKTIDTFTHPVP